jgi:hypothetical protein
MESGTCWGISLGLVCFFPAEVPEGLGNSVTKAPKDCEVLKKQGWELSDKEILSAG